MTTTGVLLGSPARACFLHAIWSAPHHPTFSPLYFRPLVLEHVDEGDEMHALVVEALPARSPVGKATEVFLATIEKDIVLAGDVDDALGLGPLENLADRVEGARLLAVGDIARVQDEGGRLGQGIDLGDRLLEAHRPVRSDLPLETDVRIADLNEGEVARGGVGGLGRQHPRREDPPADGPDEPRSRPGHALEEPATIHAIHVPLLLVAI